MQQRKLLNFKQKQRRMEIAKEMLTTFNDDLDLLQKILTGDKSWVCGYDIETKSAYIPMEASRRPKKARQLQVNVKVFLRL